MFPLGLVLLPRMPLPLHIFEERYREMIARCLSDDIPFGVLLHEGSTVHEVGCLAVIDSVINRYDDGRLDILTVGSERFRVLTLHEGDVYLEADIELFHDEPASDEHNLGSIAETAAEELRSFADAAGYEMDHSIITGLTYEELSFLLATTDVFSTEEKQQLIELRSTAERLQRAQKGLRAGRERLIMTKRIREVLGKEPDEDISHLFN